MGVEVEKNVINKFDANLNPLKNELRRQLNKFMRVLKQQLEKKN